MSPSTDVSKAQLRADLKTAMLGREKIRTRVIRSILAALTEAEVAGSEAVELTDEQVKDVIVKEAKKRREAAQAYTNADRTDLADKENEESAVLADYLPQPLSDAEVGELVRQAISDTGADSMRSMGAVMGRLTPQTKGRVDGAAVAAEVRRQLG